MPTTKVAKQLNEQTVLVLQGGGALGSYQAGAYEALATAKHKPNWIAGISIGAVNAAIIAGNRPEDRIARLHQFWSKVSSNLQGPQALLGTDGRTAYNETSAFLATMTGIPGFFTPKLPIVYAAPWLSQFIPPWLLPVSPTDALSYYDTSPLRATLLELVDFDLLNSKIMRLSIGAVHIKSGKLVYFDTDEQVIGPEHIMASGALPPGFPPVMIDGEAYWDGGIVSNTPLQYVLDAAPKSDDLCIFQVDLFSARGEMPQTMADVAEREKEIRYASRTRDNTNKATDILLMQQAAKRLMEKLPHDLKLDEDAQFLVSNVPDRIVTIVQLIHRPTSYDTQSKDVEFSRLSMDEHWSAGKKDVERTVAHPRWTARKRPNDSVTVLDLAHPKA